jgi:hypothetical protein
MPKVYYYAKNEQGLKQIAAIEPEVFESTPTLDQIKSRLQQPMGKLAPFTILTVDASSYLDKLNVGEIKYAILDGGEF